MFDGDQTKRILRDLASNDRDVHARAASVLGSLGPADSMPASLLVEALASPVDRVVFWTLIALKRLRVHPPREVVVRLALSHPMCGVREAALDYLVAALSSDEQTRSVLIAALRDPEPPVQGTAMRGILNVTGWTEAEKAKVLERMVFEPSWMWKAITARFRGD